MLFRSASAGARAQSVADFYRGRTVKFLIGGSVGGGYDLVGRLIASRIGAHIPGNPNVVAENLPSAGGLIMANTLYNREARDGSVFGMPTNAVALEPRTKALSRESGGVRFEADKFGGLGAAARQPQAMFMMADAPVKNAADLRTKKSLIAALMGSDSYILPALMNATAGTQMQIIPGYRSLADSLLAMERGEVHGHSAEIGRAHV